MKYVMCPECGKRLFKGEPGTKVEIECPKCGKFVFAVVGMKDLRIMDEPPIKDIKVSKPVQKELKLNISG